MIRVAADCDEVPFEVVEMINRVHDRSGRHIRRVSWLSSFTGFLLNTSYSIALRSVSRFDEIKRQAEAYCLNGHFVFRMYDLSCSSVLILTVEPASRLPRRLGDWRG